MKRILAIIAILFGIFQFLPFIPFPDISLSLISAGTSKIINQLVVFLLPLLTIILGVVSLFKIRLGFISLLSIFSVYFVISVSGFVKLRFWRYISSDYMPSIGRMEVMNFGNCIFFLALIILIYFNVFRSNQHLQSTPKSGDSGT